MAAMAEFRKNVLVVEDEPDVRKLYAHALTGAGFNVLTAADEDDALVLAKQHHPDLLLLDVILPKMNGLKILKKIREMDSWGAHVPAIFLTNIPPTNDEMNEAVAQTAPSYYLLKD